MGGALAAFAIGHVDPNMAYWTTSGEFVFITDSGRRRIGRRGVHRLAGVRGGAFLRLRDVCRSSGRCCSARCCCSPSCSCRRGSVRCWRDCAGAPRGGAVSPPILSVRDLGKQFGSLVAARDITVSVPPQQTVGVIGSNGAGKTTFINMITGHLRPTKGTIHFEERDITGLPSRDITRMGISRSFQVAQIFPSLTVFENMCAACAIARAPDRFVGACAHAVALAASRLQRRKHLSNCSRSRLSRHAGVHTAARLAQAARHRHGGRGLARACCCSTSRPAASRSKRNST